MPDFTATELPEAVKKLLELNHYEVTGPVQVNGAEIDLVARPLGDPFGSSMYIEVTVQYVTNDKYAKDLTKLQMVREMDASSRCLIVSSSGFTIDVKARADATRITTLTYDQLFSQFEQFDSYVNRYLGEGTEADEIRHLFDVYQPPEFNDANGVDPALEWLDTWIDSPSADNAWLILVGEYGTGKTALTRILQHRWLDRYKSNPSAPIPIRIELGNFTRQFDAQGLLHHFLDNNNLGHVPVAFLWSLIRAGRVVLILDGYDEMAQYLNQRERRECLKTLAELTGGGARGILTSRPNYFSDAEEFALFDHLYRNIELRSAYLADRTEELRRREAEIDELIEKSILDRYERALQDLSPLQTEQLVKKILEGQSGAADVVIGILNRVFRTTEEGNTIALSGKPVIISYLVEVAASLGQIGTGNLSEWDVYTLVLDQLALRDLEQAGRVTVEERRQFLQYMATWLSTTGVRQLDESQFRNLIKEKFSTQFRHLQASRRDAEVENYFEDLRRSGTLSRSGVAESVGWKFSHNSLREFLVAEGMIDDLRSNGSLTSAAPVTDAMRTFVASQSPDVIDELIVALTSKWAARLLSPSTGNYFSLLWDASQKIKQSAGGQAPNLLSIVAGNTLIADGIQLAMLELSSEAQPASYEAANFSQSTLSSVSFEYADLNHSSFTESLLDAVNFRNSNLEEASFRGALLTDVVVDGASLRQTDFRGMDPDSSVIIDAGDETGARVRLSGLDALGYLRHCGAETDSVPTIKVLRHLPEFAIVEKISTKLLERSPRQRLGLEQRGIASQNSRFARRYVDLLEREGFAIVPSGRAEVLEITASGRTALGAVVGGRGLHESIEALLSDR
jgi:hypothetical protein